MKQQVFLCHLCGEPMTVIPDAAGVTVRCDNPCIPTCFENVFGHGKTTQEAWEIAKQKFPKENKL